MKKALLFFSLAFIVTAAWSQSSDNNFRFGVKVQPALAWFRINSDDEVNIKSDGLPFGFGYGLITDFAFTDRYSFSTGLEIAYRGGKIKLVEKDPITGVSTTLKEKLSLQFIEIPLTLKLRTNEIGYLTYFFQVGVAPGYAIRTRAEIKIDDKVIDSNEDISDQINEFNLSMIIAAGAEYNLGGSTSLIFGLTFNNGFLDLIDDQNYDGKVTGNSNYLALTLGVLF